MVPVAIRRIHPDADLPKYQSDGAAGFDLAASEASIVRPGEVTLIPTGLVIQAPPGYFLAIVARSSTPLKRGLMVANGVGIVDADYCGPTDEVKIALYNFTTAPVSVARGDRLAQGVILPFVRAEWKEAAIEREARGGFGSTGQ